MILKTTFDLIAPFLLAVVFLHQLLPRHVRLSHSFTSGQTMHQFFQISLFKILHGEDDGIFEGKDTFMVERVSKRKDFLTKSSCAFFFRNVLYGSLQGNLV